jgi:cobalt-zinc-cadmium efflux system outer membrane protein
MRRSLYFAVFVLAAHAACASTGSLPTRQTVSDELKGRTGADPAGFPIYPQPSLPPGVATDDGLSAPEAVSIALWNNPNFQVALADLGFARADLVEASQLRNPILSLLFPWGPKQFEATLQLPIEAIWQRPKRIKVASLNADAIGARLMSDGLGVVALSRSAYVDASATEARVRLAQEIAGVWNQLRTITEARLREGDISELEARSVRSEAGMAAATARGAEGDRDVARIHLEATLGYPIASAALIPIDDLVLNSCLAGEQQMADAMAARPDVRAAELAVEAAGAQVGLEKARILNLTATLDANGEGKQGFEMGPGLGIDIPIDGNAGARSRAAALLQQAGLRYSAVRIGVQAELRTAATRLARARDVLRVWDEDVIETLQVEGQQASKAYQAGEVPLYSVLDTARRIVTARRARLDARVELLHAAIALDRAIGKSCAFP